MNISDKIKAIELLAAYAFLLIGIGCAAKGWLTNTPDSSRRLTYRVAWFICLLAFAVLLHGADKHRTWFDWLWFTTTFVYGASRLEYWWRARERMRKAERLLGRRS